MSLFVYVAGEHREGDWGCDSQWWDLCCDSPGST